MNIGVYILSMNRQGNQINKITFLHATVFVSWVLTVSSAF